MGINKVGVKRVKPLLFFFFDKKPEYGHANYFSCFNIAATSTSEFQHLIS